MNFFLRKMQSDRPNATRTRFGYQNTFEFFGKRAHRTPTEILVTMPLLRSRVVTQFIAVFPLFNFPGQVISSECPA